MSMLNKLTINYLLILLFLSSMSGVIAQVKIGENIEDISPYAVLELESTTKGLLLPRMNTQQRDATFDQAAPIGIMIFNTDENVAQYFIEQIDPTSKRKTGLKVWENATDETPTAAETLPASADLGHLFFNTQDNTLYYYTPDGWQALSSGAVSGNLSSNTVFEGDTLSYISNGVTNTLDLSSLGSSTLTVTGTLLGISNGNIVDLADAIDARIAASGISSNSSSQVFTATGPAGPPGSPGAAGAPGAAGQDGAGFLVAAAAPSSTVASPTFYVNSTTGDQYYNTGGGSTWTLLTGQKLTASALSANNTMTLAISNGNTVTLDFSSISGGSGTDTQTIAYGTSATSTTTTLEIINGNALTLQTTGTLEMLQTGTNTLQLVGKGISATGSVTLEGPVNIVGDLNVTGTTTLTGPSRNNGEVTNNVTTTLNAALVDGYGNAGTAGQVLSTTGTETQWITTGILPATAGQNTNTTAYWNGSAWVNNQKLQSDGSNTTTITTDLSVTATDTTINSNLTVTGDNLSLTGTTTISGDAINLTGPTTLTGNATVTQDLAVNGTANITGNATVTQDLVVSGNQVVSGNATVTSDLVVAANTTASGTLTANSTTTLNAALVDGYGNAGTAGQVLSTTGTETQWITTAALPATAGQNTNTTAYWNGSAWVNNQKLQSDGSNTTTITTDLSVTATDTTINSNLTVTGDNLSLTGTTTISGDAINLTGPTTLTGNATVTQDLAVNGTANITGNATVTSDLVVAANTTARGTLTANTTTTLNAALVDSLGEAGTEDQILSTTGTSTVWIDNYAPVSGTVTNSTLRWNGTAWVENQGLQSDGSATTSVTTELIVGNNATVTGTLAVTGNTTVTGDAVVEGSTTLATTTLGAVLQDYEGDNGTAGQVLSSTGTSTNWVDSYAPVSGTTTNSTLRWNGTAWVENQGLQSDGSATTSVTTELIVGNNATVTGTLAVTGNTTVTGDAVVEGSTTLATTTLGAVLQDYEGDNGTAGQVLSSTGTSTNWVDSYAPVSGTVTNSTLRWNGTAWVENQGLQSDGSATTSVTTELIVGNNATVTGTLAVTGNTTVTGDAVVEGSTTLATTTLGAVLQDYEGDNGTAGQVLSSTGTSTNWVDSYAPVSGTTTNSTLRWNGTAWVENQGLQSDGSATTSVTTELIVGNNATVTGTLAVTGNTTVTGDAVVEGSTTLATTTLGAVLQDYEGDNGTAGQVLSSTGTSTNWVDSYAPVSGTVTNSTLRWNGTAWVENQGLQSDGSATTSVTTELIVGNNATVTGTLAVTGNTTVTGDAVVEGSTTLATTTLGAVLQDYEGDNGTAGQVLSSTGTSTNWVDSYAPVSGTVTNSTLRWNGTAWVENQGLQSDGSATTSVTTELIVGNNATVTGTLAVTGNTTVTGDAVVEGSTTLATTTLGAVLQDYEGDNGTAGQVLSSTGTSTNWVTNSTIIDSDGDTQIQVEEGSDDDTIRFDTAGAERMTISDVGTVTIGLAANNPGTLVINNDSLTASPVIPSLFITADRDSTLPGNPAGTAAIGVGRSPQGTYSGQLRLLPRYYNGSAYVYTETGVVVDPVGSSGDVRLGVNTSTPAAFLDIEVVASSRKLLVDEYTEGGVSQVYIKAANNSTNPEHLNIIGDNIRFHNGTTGQGTETMRIDNSGNVGIGTDSPGKTLTVSGTTKITNSKASSSATAGNEALLHLNSPKNTVSMFIGDNGITSGYGDNEYSGAIRFNGANVAWGDISYYPKGGGNGKTGHFRFSTAGSSVNTTPNAKLGVGNLYVASNIGIGITSPSHILHINGQGRATNSAWATTSDQRIKRNITNYTSGLAELMRVRPVDFQYNEQSGHKDLNKHYVGVLAQEIEEVLPGTVNTINDSEGKTGLADLRLFDASELTFTLINAVKELKAENDALKAALEALVQRVEQLENYE